MRGVLADNLFMTCVTARPVLLTHSEQRITEGAPSKWLICCNEASTASFSLVYYPKISCSSLTRCASPAVCVCFVPNPLPGDASATAVVKSSPAGINGESTRSIHGKTSWTVGGVQKIDKFSTNPGLRNIPSTREASQLKSRNDGGMIYIQGYFVLPFVCRDGK